MRFVLRSTVAGLVAVAAGWFVAVPPAAAAACTKGTGVTVVVGSSVRCVPGGGGNAAAKFEQAGHTLTQTRGFVCKVDGAPSTARCQGAEPADAYWGLFWSNGTSGSWTYSSVGTYSLNVPTGGWVAFVFQNGGSTDYPSPRPVGPNPPAPPPKPKPTTPKPAPTSATSTTPAPGEAKPGSSASADAEEDEKGKESAADEADPDAETEDDTSAGPSTERVQPTSADAASSPGPALWGGVALAVLLLAGLGVVAVQRRKASG